MNLLNIVGKIINKKSETKKAEQYFSNDDIITFYMTFFSYDRKKVANP